MESNLEMETVHEIVLEVLDHCENVIRAEHGNNANDYNDVSAYIEDVIDLLNQIYVQPVFHNDETKYNQPMQIKSIFSSNLLHIAVSTVRTGNEKMRIFTAIEHCDTFKSSNF